MPRASGPPCILRASCLPDPAAGLDSGYMCMRWVWMLCGRIPHNCNVPLDIWPLFLCVPCFWQSARRRLRRRSTRNMGNFWETTTGLFPYWFDSGYMFLRRVDISRIFKVKMDLGSRGPCRVLFTPGNLDDFYELLISGSRPPIHGGFWRKRQFLGAFGRTSRIFQREGGNSDPEVDFVVCTVDASVALPRWLHVKIWTLLS